MGLEDKDIKENAPEIKEETTAPVVPTPEDKLAKLRAKLSDKEKELDSKKKYLSKLSEDEERDINITVTQKRAALEGEYDRDIRRISKEIDEQEAARKKAKDKGVKSRISDETLSLRQEKEALKGELKSFCKENKLPGFLTSKLYYTLWCPASFLSWLILILLILIVMFIPFAMAYIIRAGAAAFIISIVILCALIVAYFMVRNITIDRHRDKIRDTKNYMSEIKAKEKAIKAKTKEILKSTDEHMYDLAQFDNNISSLNDKLKESTEAKQIALKDFDDNIRAKLIADIKSKYSEQIEDTKQQIENTKSDIEKLTAEIKEEQKNTWKS